MGPDHTQSKHLLILCQMERFIHLSKNDFLKTGKERPAKSIRKEMNKRIKKKDGKEVKGKRKRKKDNKSN